MVAKEVIELAFVHNSINGALITNMTWRGTCFILKLMLTPCLNFTNKVTFIQDEWQLPMAKEQDVFFFSSPPGGRGKEMPSKFNSEIGKNSHTESIFIEHANIHKFVKVFQLLIRRY